MVSFELSVRRKQFWSGMLLGILSAGLIYIFRDSYMEGTTRIPHSSLLAIPFLVMFPLIGSVKLVPGKPAFSSVLNGVWSFAMAAGTLLWSFTALDALAVWNLPLKFLCLNLAFILAFAHILCFATGKWRLSVNIAAIVLFAVAVINSFVWQFRGRELLFTDISAAGTALAVVQEYAPAITLRMALGLGVWLLVWFSQFSFEPTPGLMKQRRMHLAAAAMLLALMIAGSWNTPLLAYGTRGTTENGFYVNFLLSIRDSRVRAPEGYSPKEVARLEQQHPAGLQPNDELPDIIVIMNESFSDFRVLGEHLHTNQPVMPFFDSLTEDTIRGYAYASVYGGSTANSEFEFLTGSSMSFFPAGTTPYQTYLNADTCSLAWLLDSLGYRTWGTHPYMEKNWSRNRVYPQLGFEESTFMEDYPQENYLRNWISDQEMYEYILDRVEQAPADEPQFVFGVTMQNHGGYEYTGDAYTQTISLEDCGGMYPRAEQYLSVLHASDQALEYLVSSLKESEKRTVLVFFGDHFPDVEHGLYEQIHGGALASLQEQMLLYQVPFFIWANYDIPEQTVPCTSLNFLSRYLLEAAQLELPEYHRFLAELELAIPAMNAMGYYSRSRNAFVPYEEARGEEAEWLRDYAMLQYNGFFDEKDRSSIFSRYLPGES